MNRSHDVYDAEILAMNDEITQLRKHSVKLNALGFRLAEALGEISPDGASSLEGDSAERLERLIGRLAAVVALCDAADVDPTVAPRHRGRPSGSRVRAAATGDGP